MPIQLLINLTPGIEIGELGGKRVLDQSEMGIHLGLASFLEIVAQKCYIHYSLSEGR